ncbi:MAG TPA: hypothetical protein VG406_18110 [Isosphaeraceae bacterium]|jgi:hypothetical protein|nr:hypothetical protein [Isosphaeraceae bacterium]
MATIRRALVVLALVALSGTTARSQVFMNGGFGMPMGGMGFNNGFGMPMGGMGMGMPMGMGMGMPMGMGMGMPMGMGFGGAYMPYGGYYGFGVYPPVATYNNLGGIAGSIDQMFNQPRTTFGGFRSAPVNRRGKVPIRRGR